MERGEGRPHGHWLLRVHYSFPTHALTTYYVLDPVMGTRDRAVSKTDTDSAVTQLSHPTVGRREREREFEDADWLSPLLGMWVGSVCLNRWSKEVCRNVLGVSKLITLVKTEMVSYHQYQEDTLPPCCTRVLLQAN